MEDNRYYPLAFLMKSNKIKLKEKVWKEFSRFIRLRDSDRNGNVRCCTCNKQLPWKEAQAGHFLSGRSLSILFVEWGVHAQCVGCNVYKSGNIEEYYPFMLRTYGEEKIEELKLLKKTALIKYTEQDYKELFRHYKNEADRLEKEKCQ